MPDDKLSQRNLYTTLSHESQQMGRIGHLQTVSTIPVCAGDSFQIMMNTKLRLSPLVREMMVDVQFENYVFFVPLRFFFSTFADFENFCVDPTGSGVTVPSYTVSTEGVACCGQSYIPAGETVSTYWLAGMILIWNEYFREPSDTAGKLAENYLSLAGTPAAHKWFGLPCTRLSQPFNSGVQGKTSVADRRFALVDTDKIDLNLMAQQQGQLATERRREFFGARLRDYLYRTYGTYISTDADRRPTLCMRTKHRISGYDIDGSTVETLGFNGGKGIGDATMFMPSKLFPEPGLLWIQQLVRFPTMANHQVHYLCRKSSPTAKQLLGDPVLLGENEPPLDHNYNEWFFHSATDVIDRQPYGNWLRTHPNVFNRKLYDKGGYPILQHTLNSFSLSHYHGTGDYNHMFKSQQFEDWKTQNNIDIKLLRHLSGGMSSIKSGT